MGNLDMVDSLEDILVVDNLAAVADLGMMDVLVDYLYADLVMGEPGDYRVPDHTKNFKKNIIKQFKVGVSKYTKVPLEKRVHFQKTAFHVLIRMRLY